MHKEILEREAEPDLLRHMLGQGFLTPRAYERALHITNSLPGRNEWRRFFDQLFLWLGLTLLLAGVIFFFAANWDSLGKFGRMGILGFAIAASALLACFLGLDQPGGHASLTAASALVGVFLAVHGQTYQTGADLYLLFFTWALLIVPWVFISRFTALWGLLALLLNASAYYYVDSHAYFLFGEAIPRISGALLAVNGVFLIFWAVRSRNSPWMEPWLGRILAASALFWITLAPMGYVFQYGESVAGDYFPFCGIALYLFALGSIGIWFAGRGRDVAPLAAVSLSLIIVVTSWFVDVAGNRYIVYVFASLMVVGLGVASAKALLRLSDTWEDEAEASDS